ncbi:response regulator [Trinickia dinghuensis]|nr:response regulator [Trinickia dinghuensis]
MTMIQPFAFPTTVGFVDDSADFLANLSLQLDARLAFRFFNSAEHALNAINCAEAQSPSVDRFLSRYHDRTEQSDAQEVIAMRVDAISQQVRNARRFECTSVVVVDYDMPGMNGLEVCRRITHPAVKKIVLTGKADEHLAVKGFNEGIIDRFIRKQDPDAITALNEAIDEMKEAYLRHTQRTVADALALSEYRFLNDPAFAAKAREIFRERDIVEHYLCVGPSGLLMLDGAAVPYLLAVYPEDALRATREIAAELDAPAEFLAELDEHRSVPYFWESDGLFPIGRESWREYMHPAFVVQGQERYTCALIERPPGLDLETVVAYDEYLDRLDRGEHSVGLTHASPTNGLSAT